MSFHLSEILKAIGPSASIIFAAWIFVGFLQQRYDAAVDRYRQTISDYRSGEHPADRRDNIQDQILVFKYRCQLMSYACFTGLLSAILFLLTLVSGAVDVIIPGSKFLQVFGTVALLGGFGLVILATVLVILEGAYTHRQLDAELLDVPDLARSTGQESGKVAQQQPRNVATG
ncbi:DUF2721 domain-containing protein [Bradyrhizobium sp. USDA 4471]